VLVWGLKKATHIVGVTQQCKTVIHEKFGIPNHKITVNYHGIHEKFKAAHDCKTTEKVLKRYNLTGKYIIGVSNVVPHENFDTVVRTLHSLRHQKNQDVKLLIAGDTSEAGSEFFGLIKKLKLENDIILPGFVDHDDLVHLYRGAALLLFPPLVASFPNPALEAMACGTPVVASEVGGIPEVIDGAGLLLKNPADVTEMREAVDRVLNDTELQNELKQKGFERVKEFTWEASACRVLELYEKVQNQLAQPA
jgi:glycosyltransferase involved in cell wall biosynthesis